MWIQRKETISGFGSFFQYEPIIFGMAYSGLLLDLLIIPALLFKKTRVWGFILISLFHLMNSQLFEIGIFPWFMIAATSLYFDPGWFRKFINYFSSNNWKISNNNNIKITEIYSANQKFILPALAIWVCIQVIVPIRHFFIPGSVDWTEEGHRYSWHMMLRSKNAIGIYTAKDKKTGTEFVINPKKYLTTRQSRKFSLDLI